MPEYYLKLQPQAEAQGPFSEPQMQEMAKEGRISPVTLHFYDDLVGWQPIEANQSLHALLFASDKPKLALRKKQEEPPAASTPQRPAAPEISVHQMLQAAQGHTEASKAQTTVKRWADRVAALSLPLLAIFNVVMGVLLVYAHREALSALMEGNYATLIFAPGLVLGGLILAMGGLLMLSVVAVYPAVRYLALILLGYLGLQAWSYLYEGLGAGWLLLGAGLGYGLGVYVTTLTLNFAIFVFSLLLTLGGVLSYGYFLFFLPV